MFDALGVLVFRGSFDSESFDLEADADHANFHAFGTR
jgi:hypothetical protein